MHIAPKARAFTLIELLVVITIIVVLLALLTPALDRAIYQAELAVCGASLHGTATGVLTYTMDFRKSYPYRAAVFDSNVGAQQANALNYPFSGSGNRNVNGYDDRDELRGRVALKGLVCPLTGDIDLDSSPSTTWVFSGYAMWWGWQYRTPGVGVSGNRGADPTGGVSRPAGMFRRGNRLSYTNQANPAVTFRFNVLAADHTYNAASVNAMESSHPDSNGRLGLVTAQDGGDAAFQAVHTNPNIRITRSTWSGPYGFGGLLDLNYLFDDGSVKRYDRIDHGTTSPSGGVKGNPMVFVPNSPEGFDGQWLWQMLPTMR